MGLKVLGLLCAGVFVGAALMEVRQLAWRKKKDAETDGEPTCEDEGACDQCAKDVDGAVTDKA